jgi:hypothetical protein|tara:strand:+ start:238 stop:540 length:303 start_codon:yes stop_codon:yes gene_type:complete
MENPETPYLDNLGVRKEFFLRLEQRFDKVGQDGAPYSVHKMIDRQGRKAMFYRYSSKEDLSFNEKDCILIKATVAEHRTYKDEPETYLNRVKLLKNVGSK